MRVNDYTVERITCDRSGRRDEIKVRPKDFVIVTLGSMVEASSLGSMDSAPVLKGKCDGGAWTLWKKIAAHQSQFGRPANFTDHIDESKWVSFTTTFRDPTFFRLVRDLTGNVPGEGGLITFPESAWLASIVLPHQPHFIGQPADVQVLWGYGLFVDKPGNFVTKPMSACTGREIMREIIGHLGIGEHTQEILETCTCIPCMMPFITSQFLRRAKGDRPRSCRSTRRISPSSDNSANSRKTWFLRWNIRSGPRKRPFIRCWGRAGPHPLYTEGATIHVFFSKLS